MANFYGTTNDDTQTGTGGNDNFNYGQGGDDTIDAGAGDDRINFGAAFTAADKIDGGDGNDTVILNGDYTGGNAVVFAADTMVNVENLVLRGGHSYDLTTDDATVAAGQTLTVNGGALGVGDSLTFDGSAELDGHFNLSGGKGDDALTGGALSDVINLARGGDDIANGGGGNDTFLGGGAFTGADQIDGGSGYDTLQLNGNYAGVHAVVFGAATMSNVEAISLVAGHSYNLVMDDAVVGAGQSMLVNGAGLGAGDTLTFNGSAELDGAFRIAGGAGNDILSGGSQSDIFNLSHGGDDIAHGRFGDDVFIMGAALNANDQLDGGSELDTVVLQGDYSGANAVVFNATTMTNMDYLVVQAGFNYDLTSNDGTVANFDILTVDATELGAGNSIRFDGSAETDGFFFFADGQGNDTFIGGAQSDGFSFDLGGTDTGQGGGGDDSFDVCGHFDATDQMDGGAGYDSINLTDEGGTYTGANALHLTAAMMVNFEEMQFDPGNYDITTVDANVAAGVQFTVDAGFADQVSFDGSAETDGSFSFLDSTGNDNFKGGAGDDIFDLTFGGTDSVTGGLGQDTIVAGGQDTFVYNAVAESQSTTHDIIQNFDVKADVFDLNVAVSGVDAARGGEINSATFDSNLGTVIADAMGSNHAIVVNATSGDLSGNVYLVVDANGNGFYDTGDYVFDVTGSSNLASLSTSNFI
jgi:Ca2+-binding RTX toxin-like protein